MAVPYALLFLGPFVLAAVLGKRLFGARWSAFGLGLAAFLAAWLCVIAVTSTAAALGPAASGTILYSVVVSACAGFFEESSRYLAFRVLGPLRRRRDWPTGFMYSIGHSGMESIIVGGTLILTVVVVTHFPQFLSGELLAESQAVADLGFWEGLYIAVERLVVGLLIHACFTSVVLLSFTRGRILYLGLAMAWHFAHDMVAFNIGHIGDHWAIGKAWVLFIVIVYSAVLFRLRRALPAGPVR